MSAAAPVGAPHAEAGADAEVPRLAAAFEQGAVPKAEWTHRAHLLVGLWYASRLPEADALGVVRAGILQLNGAHGVPTTPTRGYHETITRAYLRLIAGFVAEDVGLDGWAARAERLLARYGEKDCLLRYYTRDRLMSSEARFGWVEPDLRPLP